jgi:hypothetical protein
LPDWGVRDNLLHFHDARTFVLNELSNDLPPLRKIWLVNTSDHTPVLMISAVRNNKPFPSVSVFTVLNRPDPVYGAQTIQQLVQKQRDLAH